MVEWLNGGEEQKLLKWHLTGTVRRVFVYFSEKMRSELLNGGEDKNGRNGI